MVSLLLSLVLGLQFWLANCIELSARASNSDSFITVNNGSFERNGKPWGFYGTNAYWLQMATDEDMDITLHDIATFGFSVVRVWAFNDVPKKPSVGVYFQILKDGTATINEGADGLQRLDKLVSLAKRYGLKLIFSLTNNWNPPRPDPGTAFSKRDNDLLPRGYLSNDYGGIDAYVNAFTPGGTHDKFYTEPKIIDAYKNYISHVIKRFPNNPTILGWELGNDIRCNSTVPKSSSCNATTITKWAGDIAKFIKSIDNKHLVTPGDGGFYCLGCPKTFATKSTPKTPSSPTGAAFDGTFGVDTEDLASIPDVDFGSFQLFPDQVQYFPKIPKAEFGTQAIIQGSDWIALHSATATLLCKPEALTAFSIVTEDNFAFYVPFTGVARMPPNAPCGGVRRFQLDYAYVAWSSIGLTGNIGGTLEYQWAQGGLTSHGTTFDRRRQLMPSPNDGSSNYVTPYNNQTAEDWVNSFP